MSTEPANEDASNDQRLRDSRENGHSASAGALSIRFATDGSIAVAGEIDMAGGPLLEAAVRQREELRRVVIDLADVTFIDSSGLRCLLEASRRARSRGAEMVLRGVGPEVARLLEITGTTDLFEVVER